MSNRRNFLKLSAAGLAATGLSGIAPLNANASSTATASSPATATATAPATAPFKLGMAGYTFREFTVEQTITMMQRVQVDALSLKDFHLPQTSSQEDVDAIMGKFKSAGIEVYAAGVIYMKTREEVDRT